MTYFHSPSKDSSEERGVEAFRRGQPPLHLRHCHLILGGRAEEGEAARHRAEDVALEHPEVAVVVAVVGMLVTPFVKYPQMMSARWWPGIQKLLKIPQFWTS